MHLLERSRGRGWWWGHWSWAWWGQWRGLGSDSTGGRLALAEVLRVATLLGVGDAEQHGSQKEERALKFIGGHFRSDDDGMSLKYKKIINFDSKGYMLCAGKMDLEK